MLTDDVSSVSLTRHYGGAEIAVLPYLLADRKWSLANERGTIKARMFRPRWPESVNPEASAVVPKKPGAIATLRTWEIGRWRIKHVYWASCLPRTATGKVVRNPHAINSAELNRLTTTLADAHRRYRMRNGICHSVPTNH
jgi:hypothetical protein